MRFTKASAWVSVLFAVLGSQPAYAGDADFTLVNRTGYTLREIYLTQQKLGQGPHGGQRAGQRQIALVQVF